MERKILITGGEGQLGKMLKSTLEEKFNVLSTTRHPTEAAVAKGSILKMDIVEMSN